MAEGIRKRNRPKPYEASVWLAAEGRQERKSFRTLAEARKWRRDHGREVQFKPPGGGSGQTVAEAAAEFMKGAESGAIRDRNERKFKPSTIRSYDRALRLGILPNLGARQLSEVTAKDVRALVRKFRAEGLADSTVRNRLDPLRSIYRFALDEERVVYNPTAGLRLRAGGKRRDPAVSLEGANALIEAIRPADRALWATAFYAGLRRGELRALRVSDVDFEGRQIHVRRSWDDVEKEVEPKTEAGARSVALTAVLAGYLADHLIEVERGGDDLIFGRTPTAAFVPSSVGNRAKTDWKRAGLDRVTLQDCRHVFASFLIAYGQGDVKAIKEAMGHSSIQTTIDRYGHLLPDGRDRLRANLDRAFTPPNRVPVPN